MNFKEAYLDDLDETFFNPDEFASEHVIDGRSRTVILINRDAREAGRSAINPKEHSINRNIITMHIKESDVWRKLSAGATINLDGETMWISRVQHITGMVRLQMERKKT